MKPRHIIRAAVVTGWLTGLGLILDGLSLWAALIVLAAATSGGLAWVRWGAGLRIAVQLRHLLKRAVKTGGDLERA